jgi:DNA-binding IclR family transcriptional regulator
MLFARAPRLAKRGVLFHNTKSDTLLRRRIRMPRAPGRMSRAPTSSPSPDEPPVPGPAIAIQVIDRAMRLLDALAAQPDPVTLKELAATTGLHVSTAHRILNDLVVGRYVERVDNGVYQLGMRLLELGSLVKGRLNVREAALPPMRALHKLTGQTVNLSVQQGDEIVYIDRAWSERSGMQVVRAIGGRAPLHLTSTGKLFLSTADGRQVRGYAQRTGLAGHTHNSLTSLEKLDKELAQVRRDGYARDNEELEVGVRCIAAGIYDDTGKLVAGLSISAPAERLQDDWVRALKDTATHISESLGYEAAHDGDAQVR